MENLNKKMVISVSGAAETSHCGPEVLNIAKELGREIARQDCILATGATSGFPHYSAIGYNEAKGMLSLGFSPANDKIEHQKLYLLPTDFCDVIVYTGFGYPVRDIILTKASHAMVVGCGRIGTIHEFTVAFESNIPLGILEGPWATDEVIHNIIKNSNRINHNVIFDSDPKRLISRLKDLVDIEKKNEELGDTEMTTKLKVKV